LEKLENGDEIELSIFLKKKCNLGNILRPITTLNGTEASKRLCLNFDIIRRRTSIAFLAEKI
jgi:hypothetical protein